MKKIIYICVLLLSLSTIAQTTITKNLGDFTAIKVYNGIEAELIKSDSKKLVITGDKSEKVSIKNVNGVLKISLPFSLKPKNNAANGQILAKIFYNSNIDLIDANQGATITGKEIIQDKIEINAQEKAFINLVLKVKDLKVRATSGGNIKLTGTTDNQNVFVDLYSTYNGFAMQTISNVNVKAGTGAKAEVLAGKILKAKVNFGGSIFYKGDPVLVSDKKVLGGIIQKRN
ncbi:head GIN domain-containing protein [uncultured Polaribacter sp.]|uniref:head GIN domain-containing protein n=1 Tax=uncultured Polaribacter sp. TaxID=174711 RepID=UPI002632BFFF|nr:head GIN domain-containing protein [uncultured Polaribacter sp.]